MSIEEIAKQMVAKGKGILAADESTGTMEKKIKKRQRRMYRKK